jgi:hypothetical protein
MAEDDEPRWPADPAALFAQQLRDAADRLMTGWPVLPGAAGTARQADDPEGARPGLPLPPATLTARHLQVVVDDIESRRAQVQALRTSLGTFDEQLGALEATLRPLLEWTGAWADLEGDASGLWRLPEKRSRPD